MSVMVIDLQTAIDSLLNDFPQLRVDGNFHQISDPNPQYNCIAWALGIDNLFVSPDNVPWHWWPLRTGDLYSEQALIDCFKFFGFDDCGETDFDPEYDKVALYSLNGRWTHAARVVDKNMYYSKFGYNIDGYHSSGDKLSSKYGTVYKYMRRKVSDSQISSRIRSTLPPPQNYIHSMNGDLYVQHIGHLYKVVSGQII